MPQRYSIEELRMRALSQLIETPMELTAYTRAHALGVSKSLAESAALFGCDLDRAYISAWRFEQALNAALPTRTQSLDPARSATHS